MKPSRRALILSTLIEAAGAVLLGLSHGRDLPYSVCGRIASVLHLPGIYTFALLGFPRVSHELVFVALVQWLFWFAILGLAFFFWDAYRHRNDA